MSKMDGFICLRVAVQFADILPVQPKHFLRRRPVRLNQLPDDGPVIGDRRIRWNTELTERLTPYGFVRL